MKPGFVAAFVGPSGVGKDSVMAGLSEADPDLQMVRRVITRAPGLGGEHYQPVDDAEFARRLAANAFCLHWPAHGLHYGIPNDIRTAAIGGQSFLVNLSRSVLAQAQEIFPAFVVLRLTASPQTLAARLAGRGREDHSDIRARLDRPGPTIPAHVNIIDIANDGPLTETVEAALAALQPLRV